MGYSRKSRKTQLGLPTLRTIFFITDLQILNYYSKPESIQENGQLCQEINGAK